MGPIENSRKWSSRTIIRKFQGCFVFIPKYSGDIFLSTILNILVIKCEEHNLRKSKGTKQKNSKYCRQLEQLSRNFQPFSSFRNFQAIFAPSDSYFTEKCCWVPLIIITGKGTKKLFPILVNKGTNWKLGIRGYSHKK